MHSIEVSRAAGLAQMIFVHMSRIGIRDLRAHDTVRVRRSGLHAWQHRARERQPP
jgi:hypothetical protein